MSNLVLEQALKDYNYNIVSIDHEKIETLILDKGRAYFYFTKKPSIEINNYKENIKYILGLHSINFQYWDIGINGYTRYSNNGKVGALASYEGYNKLYEQHILKGKKIDNITHSEMHEYFGEIPSLHARVLILKESLSKNLFELSYEIIMQEVSKKNLLDVNTAKKLSDLLPKSYSDPYLKKIQLALFEITELLKFKHPRLTCDLTVAADYQIPKVLNALGILIYSKNLEETIKNQIAIEQDSHEELAIRAASVLACEEICKKHNIDQGYIDKFLWEQRNNFPEKNFHLTKTKRY